MILSTKGHEARVTARPLHYLLLKGEHDFKSVIPSVWAINVQEMRPASAQAPVLYPPDTHASGRGGGRETRPEQSVVCDGGVYSTQGLRRSGAGEGGRGAAEGMAA